MITVFLIIRHIHASFSRSKEIDIGSGREKNRFRNIGGFFLFLSIFLENERNAMHERFRGTASPRPRRKLCRGAKIGRPFLSATHASGALLFTCNLETLDRKKNR